jgi:hypothetical protein
MAAAINLTVSGRRHGQPHDLRGVVLPFVGPPEDKPTTMGAPSRKTSRPRCFRLRHPALDLATSTRNAAVADC